MEQNLIEINKIKLDETKIINSELVEKLAESIEIVGLLNPIVLTPDFNLVAGRHRIEAYKIIGCNEIPASFITLDEMHQRIATIDENLIRKVLTKLEEAEQLSERKKIYETLFPETRRGMAGALAKHNGATDKMSFAADVASKTGQTERNVNRKIAIYERLYPEVRELVRNSAIANNFSEISRLCDYDFDMQIEIAEMIQAGKAKSVIDADRLNYDTFLFKNTERGKFQKSVKLAEKALKQLVDGGIVKDLVGRIAEMDYVFMKDEVVSSLASLHNLRERINIAVKIFEDKIQKLEKDTFAVQAEDCDMGLAE